MSSRIAASIGGRPGRPLLRWVHFLLTSSRCQRRRVAGVTRKATQRSRGMTRLAAARRTRSIARSLGGPGPDRGLLLGRPEHVGELLGRRLEVGGRLRVDVLLVLAGQLEQVPDLRVEVRECGEVLGLEVVGPDDLYLVLDLLGVLLLHG